MVIVIINKNDGIYSRQIKVFKRKGIKYLLFKLYCKITNKHIEVVM